MQKSKKKKSAKEIRLDQRQIMDSRNTLAVMLASVSTSWKTGIPYADLIASAERENLKPETFFLEIADTIGTMFTMVEGINPDEEE
tara:strand:- start:605 stop:862 length:258 start_codon:yes stop_codon:yes gene_type:complete